MAETPFSAMFVARRRADAARFTLNRALGGRVRGKGQSAEDVRGHLSALKMANEAFELAVKEQRKNENPRPIDAEIGEVIPHARPYRGKGMMSANDEAVSDP